MGVCYQGLWGGVGCGGEDSQTGIQTSSLTPFPPHPLFALCHAPSSPL